MSRPLLLESKLIWGDEFGVAAKNRFRGQGKDANTHFLQCVHFLSSSRSQRHFAIAIAGRIAHYFLYLLFCVLHRTGTT